ncbi:terpene synthase family protein [Nonomuraea lactucae]|uniref:terpene synthase family protein n=1 Tax=Nonomuraea lactucae TaxID=2249762 RepID=UPI000DE20EF6|nr:terpene synthase family protein [Nonomuraea lactucae]
MPDGELDEAFEVGRACALAAECGRDLRRCAQMYGGLFPAAAFDPDLYTSLTLAGAFSSPWSTAGGLKVANRAALWVLAVDRLVDHTSTDRDQVEDLVHDCLAVADGAVPRAAVTRFLADLRDELDTVEDFGRLHGLWRDQLATMLTAMARAWVWRDRRDVPTFGRYVDNADSRGSCFVDLSHWIYAGDEWARRHLDELRPVSAHVQRYLHLLGDLASYRKDVNWGDLNVLMLGVSRSHVADAMAELEGEAADLIGGLRERSPRTAAYLRRRMGFHAGFHGVAR